MYKPKHIYNLKQDKPDSRDKILKYVGFKNIKLPSSIDTRPDNPPIQNQQDIGSCAANSGAGEMSYMVYKATGKFVDFSRMALYNLARMNDGNFQEDAGTYLRTIIKILAKYGIPPESAFQYTKDNLFIEPSQEVLALAEKYQALSYYRILNGNVLLVKQALASGYDVIFGATLYESFESEATAKTGIIAMPDEKQETIVGGHATRIVGYDDSKQWFIDANSWGTEWGDKGYCYMPYDFFRKYASDVWAITKTETGE